MNPLDLNNLAPPPEDLPPFEYLANAWPRPHGQNDLTIPYDAYTQGQLRAYLVALKVMSGMAYELKISLVLIGGFAMRMHGRVERAVRDLDFLASKSDLDRIDGVIRQGDERFKNLTPGADGGVYNFACDQYNVRIECTSIDILKKRNRDMMISAEDVFRRSVTVFDDHNYRVTTCVGAGDLFDLKYWAMVKRAGDDDFSDVQWLVKNKGDQLTTAQLESFNNFLKKLKTLRK